MPPSIPLLVAVTLLLAQLFHVVSPHRISYRRRVALAVLGVAIGEFAGSHLLPPGPRLGELHPLWDIVATTILQLMGNRFLR